MLNDTVFVSAGNLKPAELIQSTAQTQVREAADLFDDVVEENNLREFHGEVVLVGARLQVADHRRPYTERRHKEAGEDEICRGPCLGVHQQQGDIFPGNPFEQVQNH